MYGGLLDMLENYFGGLQSFDPQPQMAQRQFINPSITGTDIDPVTGLPISSQTDPITGENLPYTRNLPPAMQPQKPQIGILNQRTEQQPRSEMPEQAPRAEARPEPKPEYNPQSPGILGKPMTATTPTDPYAFDFKKNWPLLLMQFANGMGKGNMGRNRSQRIWGALAGGATNTGNYLQQYPQQKMQEAMLRGKVDEVQRQRELRAKFQEYLGTLTPEQRRLAELLGPEKWADKNMASTPSGYVRDENGNLRIDSGYLQSQALLKQLGAPKVFVDARQKTEDAFSKGMGEINAKRIGEWQTQADAARTMNMTLEPLRDVLAKTPTGPLFNGQLTVGQFAKQVGIDPSEIAGISKDQIVTGELAKSLISQGIVNSARLLPGQFTEREAIMMRETLPNLANSPQGNAAIVQLRINVNNRKAAMLSEMSKYATANRGSMEGWEEYSQKWLQAQPDIMRGINLSVPTAPTQTRPKVYDPATGTFK